MILFRFVLLAICVGITLGGRRIATSHRQAVLGQFPYHVSLRYNPDTIHRCSGSLISDKHILTAAQCVYNLVKTSHFDGKAVVGTHCLRRRAKEYKFKDTIYHTYYDPVKYYHDIAIIRVYETIIFNNYTKAIPLQTSDVKPHSILIVTGWRCSYCQEEYGQENPTLLMYSELLVVELAYCQNIYKSVSLDVICTTKDCNEGVCNTDTGAPLMYQGRVAGIVSFGIKCAPCSPDVATKVSVYVDWIQDTLLKLCQ